jgi:hypothetical protein
VTGLERIWRDSHGLDESKAITSEVYVPLASEPIGRWPTGRNRLVLFGQQKLQVSVRVRVRRPSMSSGKIPRMVVWAARAAEVGRTGSRGAQSPDCRRLAKPECRGKKKPQITREK